MERCSVIQSEIARLEAIELASKEAGQNRERHDVLQPLRFKLDEAAEKANVLREMGIQFASWPPNPKVLALFYDYRQAVDDPATGKRNAFGSLNNALTTLADTTTDQVRKTIDSLSARNPDAEESFIKQYDGIPSLQAKVTAARTKRVEFQSVTGARHRSVLDLRKFISVRSELWLLTDELKHQHLPPEVHEFYQAVHSGKATIETLTSSVRSWLEANDQLKELRITLRPR
jgi:hypothetical protein